MLLGRKVSTLSIILWVLWFMIFSLHIGGPSSRWILEANSRDKCRNRHVGKENQKNWTRSGWHWKG